MTDISIARKDGDRAMCIDPGCPSREECLRAMADPAEFQVYADTKRPVDSERCDSFISMEAL